MRIVKHVFFFKFDIYYSWGMRKEKALPVLCSNRTNVDPFPPFYCLACYKTSYFFFWFPLLKFPLLTTNPHATSPHPAQWVMHPALHPEGQSSHPTCTSSLSRELWKPSQNSAGVVYHGCERAHLLGKWGRNGVTKRAGFGHFCVLWQSFDNEWAWSVTVHSNYLSSPQKKAKNKPGLFLLVFRVP